MQEPHFLPSPIHAMETVQTPAIPPQQLRECQCQSIYKFARLLLVAHFLVVLLYTMILTTMIIYQWLRH